MNAGRRFWQRERRDHRGTSRRRTLALGGTLLLHGLLLGWLLSPADPLQLRPQPWRAEVEVPRVLQLSLEYGDKAAGPARQQASAAGAAGGISPAQSSTATLRPAPARVQAAIELQARALHADADGTLARSGPLSAGSARASEPVTADSIAPAISRQGATVAHAAGRHAAGAQAGSGSGSASAGQGPGRQGLGGGGAGPGGRLEAQCRRAPYPELASARGWQGRVEIEVVLDDRGQLLDARVARSSGHVVLDRSALQWARRCNYSAPPVQPGTEVVGRMPVDYRLRGVSVGALKVATQ